MNWKQEYEEMINKENISYNLINEYLKPHRPKHLYRYRCYGKEWEGELFKGNIYMAPPIELNDPFDSSLYINKESLEKHVYNLLPKARLNFDEIFAQTYNDMYRKIFDSFKVDSRIACFSANRKSILMWSHYGIRHEGYCIEYDTSKLNYNKYLILPVLYKKLRYDAAEFLNMLSEDCIIKPFIHKSNIWNYEDEWRIISSKEYFNESVGNYYSVPEAISAIYLGVNSYKRDPAKIIEWAREQDIPIYKYRVSKTQYALIRERI